MISVVNEILKNICAHLITYNIIFSFHTSVVSTLVVLLSKDHSFTPVFNHFAQNKYTLTFEKIKRLLNFHSPILWMKTKKVNIALEL